MNRNIVSRRDDVVVPSGLCSRRQLLGLAGAVQPRPEQISLRRVRGRSVVIEPAAGQVDLFGPYHVEVSRSDALYVASVSRHRVDVAPAVSLAGPQKPLAMVHPLDVSTGEALLVPIEISPRDVDPGVVFLGKNGSNPTVFNAAQHHDVRVLQAVELLTDHFVVCP